MINWRNGKAGFVGSAKNLIKSVFNFQVTTATEIVETYTVPIGVSCTINGDPTGLASSIEETLSGLSGYIIEDNGISSTINNEPAGTRSSIEDINTGVKGTI